jgi:hypothetical protein
MSSLPEKTRRLPEAYNPRDVEQAIRDIYTALNKGFSYIVPQVRNVEPEKTVAYMVVMADGTNWNPGFGRGWYRRSGSNSRWLRVLESELSDIGSGLPIYNPIVSGQLYEYASVVNYSGATTLTVADLKVKVIRNTGAAANWTTPTGTEMDTGYLAGALPVDYGTTFSIVNEGSGTITVVAGTDITLRGAATITAGASGLFRFRKTATNTFTITRIA